MATDQNDSLQHNDDSTTMVYFNPQLMQSLAGMSAGKEQNFRELLSAAEEGDLDAAHQLAQNYCHGRDGAPKDEEKAFYWFKKAAEGDHISAQYSLGLCYIKGVGTEKDEEKAVELFTGAAEQG